MAKRRRSRGRVRRAVSRVAKRVGRRASPKPTRLVQPDAMIYGALRGFVSDAIAPVFTNFPIIGQFGGALDEVAMGTLAWFVAKNSSGMIKNIATKGLVVENARFGEALLQGGFGVAKVQAPTLSVTTA